MGNTILDRTGAPSYTWLLCLAHVCFILNFTVSSALNAGVPIQRATGSTYDIGPLLRFHVKNGDASLALPRMLAIS
jgi:hypothetical protein